MGAALEQVARGRRAPSKTELATTRLGEAKVRAEAHGRDLIRAFEDVEKARAELHSESGIVATVRFDEPAVMDAYRRSMGEPFWERRP